MVQLKCGLLGHTPVPLCSPSPERAIRLVSVGSTGSTGKREAPTALSAPGTRVSNENRLGTVGPRAEGVSYTVPTEKGCSFCLRVPRLSDTSRSAWGPSKAPAQEGLQLALGSGGGGDSI